jgi:hypothetical protein
MSNINEFRKKIGKLPIDKRLEICENLSKQRMMKNAPKPASMINTKIEPYNHELEMIAFNSVIVDNRLGFDELPLKWILSCTRFIRSQEFLTEQTKNYGVLKLISALGFTQFEGQQHFDQLYYRYNYLYNYQSGNVDMKTVFFNKFGISYEMLQRIVLHFQLWALMDKHNLNADQFLKQKLKKKYFSLLAFLIKKRDDFIEEYQDITANDDFFSFLDLNLLIKYPIIDYNNKLFIPYVPYIIYAITKTLMFRITEGDNQLRSLIGKNVIEGYVQNLLQKSNVTNKLTIINEFYYENGKKSSDFIVQSNTELLFIEVKFFNQGLKLRTFDQTFLEDVFNKISGYIFQVYRNFHYYSKGEMNHILKPNLYPVGIIVLYDDFLFIKDSIYDTALKMINHEFNLESTKEDLAKKILIMPLTSFETILRESKQDIFTWFKHTVSRSNAYLDFQYVAENKADSHQISDYDDYLKRIYHLSEEDLYEFWEVDEY